MKDMGFGEISIVEDYHEYEAYDGFLSEESVEIRVVSLKKTL